jgi:hypothetical protein
MTQNELQFPDDHPDREIGEALRPLLSPASTSESYWSGLESRILQRIGDERSSPWSVLASWSRPAAVAAALLLAAASVMLTQLRHEEEAVAYGAMAEEQYPVAEPATLAAPGSDATVHMLLEH